MVTDEVQDETGGEHTPGPQHRRHPRPVLEASEAHGDHDAEDGDGAGDVVDLNVIAQKDCRTPDLISRTLGGSSPSPAMPVLLSALLLARLTPCPVRSMMSASFTTVRP
jgi:hypothetical protein